MADVNKEIGIRIDVITEDVQAAQKRISDLEAHISKLTGDLEGMRKKSKKGSDEMAAGFKAAEEQAKSLPGPIGAVADGIGSATYAASLFVKGLSTLRGAIMATGIGALAVILAGLYEAFTGTERGAQRFRVLMAALGGLMDGVNTMLENIGNALIDLFDKPSETLKSFGQSIRTYVVENFQKILNGAGTLGQAMSKLFAGDFAGALDTAKKGAKELGDGFLSLNPATAIAWNLAKGVNAVAKEGVAAAAALAALEVRMNAVKVAERDLTVERAKSNKTIAEARLIADDATKSIDERIAAVKLAGQIEQQVVDQELKTARERLAILEGQKAAGKEEEQQLDAIAVARARVYDLMRENIEKRKRLQSEELGLLREAEAQKKALDDAELARMKELADERQRLFEQEQALLKSNLAALTDARIAAMDDEWQKELAQTQLNFERKIAAIQGNGEIESELRTQLEENMGAELAAINKKWLEKNLAQTRAKNDEILANEERLREARLNMAQATGGGLIAIGKVVSAAMADNAEVAKGIAVAEVWINAATATASAISKAVQSSVTPYDMIANIAVAVGTVAGAIASTISILDKANIPGGSGGSVGAMPSFQSTAPSAQPVATNVTGLVNTQQAELQPIQAFVVETQMTGSQSNMAQIYSQATFGLDG